MKKIFLLQLLVAILTTACAHHQSDQVSSSDGEMELLTTSTGFAWVALRYNTTTGETWFHFPYYWRTINEEGPIAPSQYVVQIIGFGGNHWASVRIDTQSGRCWMLLDSTWKEITWNLPIKSMNGAYGIEMVSSGDRWEVIWYDSSTGESFLLDYPIRWELLPEKKKPDRSDYVVRMVGENGWLATRMDTLTGKFWILETKKNEHLWIEMEMDVKTEQQDRGSNDSK